ncbi:MAG: hypothetical protein IID44_19665 [Planctomycetes bacterium]|nr:hypothetical protein [Planctomycetota bacterium]
MHEWLFRTMRLSEQNRNPIESEFFNPDDAIGALVREAVQNSLDAVDTENGSDAIRVRFYISCDSDALTKEKSNEWLAGLDRHLTAAGIDEPWNGSSRMGFVTVEDFGTRGLCGDPTAARKSELGETRQDFYYFWRNIGITGKTGSQLGSWGLGKAVYASASRIRSMFGLTVRSNDPERTLLMGQAATGIHELTDLEGKTSQHDAYGFFGVFGQRDDPHFATPIYEVDVIARFREQFKLSRDGQPGLSLVIPFPSFDLADEEALRQFVLATIKHYAYPILAKQLEVEIATPSSSVSLKDQDSLITTLSQIEWHKDESEKEKIEHLILLALWALEESDPYRITLERENNKRASWDEITFPGDELAKCQERFGKREYIAIRVPVLVRVKDGDNYQSHFDVYLGQEESITGSICHFIRQGLTISEVPGPETSGIVGLVIVEDARLAELMREAENPAHTRWQPGSKRLKQRFTGGPDRVRLVTSAPRALLKMLLATAEKADTDLLAEFFPDVDPDAMLPKEKGGKSKGTKKKLGEVVVPPPTPSPLKLTKSKGGFSYVRDPAVPLTKRNFRIRVGYDCTIGNPFKNWEKFDFRLHKLPIRVDVTDGAVVKCEDNRLAARIDSDAFRLSVSGFSPERDVAVSSLEWLVEEEDES